MTPPNGIDTARALDRTRTFQRRQGAVVDKNRYEVFSLQCDLYRAADSLKAAQQLAQQAAEDVPGRIVSIWSPTRGHVYQATVRKGQYRVLHGKLHTAYFDTPEEVVDALVIYIDERDDLREMLHLVNINMADLWSKGHYDSQSAVRAYIPLADDAVRRYDEQYGGTMQEQYPHDVRRMTAERLRSRFEQERREDPEKFVEQYVKPRLEGERPSAQTINLGDADGRNVVVNLYVGETEEANG